MKKLLALILAAALTLSLVACGGGSGAGDNNTPSGGNEEYSIGDTISTDCIEVSVIGYDILTTTTILNNSNSKKRTVSGDTVETVLYYRDYFDDIDLGNGKSINTYSDNNLENLCFSTKYLDYNGEERAYIILFYSAKNIGKEVISCDHKDIMGVGTITQSEVVPFGDITLDYDDGYKFECGGAFSKDLPVLSDGYIDMSYAIVPIDVANSSDKTLKAIISLPNSANDTVNRTEFTVNLR